MSDINLSDLPDYNRRITALEQAFIAIHINQGGDKTAPTLPGYEGDAEIHQTIVQYMQDRITQAIDRVEFTIKQIDILAELATLAEKKHVPAIKSDVVRANGTAALVQAWVDTQLHDDDGPGHFLGQSFTDEAISKNEQNAERILETLERTFGAVKGVTQPHSGKRSIELLGELKENRQDLAVIVAVQGDVQLKFAETLMGYIFEGRLDTHDEAFKNIFGTIPLNYIGNSLSAVRNHVASTEAEMTKLQRMPISPFKPYTIGLKPLELQF